MSRYAATEVVGVMGLVGWRDAPPSQFRASCAGNVCPKKDFKNEG